MASTKAPRRQKDSAKDKEPGVAAATRASRGGKTAVKAPARKPRAATKTTGETGRNVAVPRSRTRNGASRAPTPSRWATRGASASSGTSTGGHNVMWVGMPRATASPSATR